MHPAVEFVCSMQCLHPVTIKNPRWGTSKQTIEDTYYIQVPCGRCINCQNNRRSSWVLRNRYENLHCISSIFVTLTYSDENLPWFGEQTPSLDYEDVKKFMKRLRKKFPETKLRYFLCGEYGSKTLRPHYHAIIYDLPLLDNGKDFVEYYRKVIADTWGLGNVSASPVNDNRIGYITKYIIKSDYDKKQYAEFEIRPPKLLVSRGFGKELWQYVSKTNGGVRFFGHSTAAPRYVIEAYRQNEPDDARLFDDRRKEFIAQRRRTLLQMRYRNSRESPFRDSRSEYISQEERARRLFKRCKTQKDF